jgi:hypothetical protein
MRREPSCDVLVRSEHGHGHADHPHDHCRDGGPERQSHLTVCSFLSELPVLRLSTRPTECKLALRLVLDEVQAAADFFLAPVFEFNAPRGLVLGRREAEIRQLLSRMLSRGFRLRIWRLRFSN